MSLQNTRTPYPLQASVQVGKTTIDVQGNLTKPSNLATLGLHLKVSGASMEDLYSLIGIVLPAMSPYVTEGRLIDKLH
ncbi:MAG: hypothetical protein H7240_08420 [Glaciimonas sp.]|nr:hypothetical protein [Glaciimonas sp.]